MDIIEEVKNYVIERCNEYKETAEDHYDYWNEHIRLVYEEAVSLAKEYNADIEIVSLGALLHDIALINRVGGRGEHHINGEKIAREILTNLNYDINKLERVAKCVLNHRSSKNTTSIEETCVADADVLAHFANVPLVFNYAFNTMKLDLNNVREWVNEAMEKDYNDLSDVTKEHFKDKYKLIRKIVLNEKD